MTHINPRFRFILNEPAPRMLIEARNLYGVKEYKGSLNNPQIISWAHELKPWIGDMYDRGGDAVPWCGLFMGIVAKRAGKPMPNNPLSALAWSDWGNPVTTPKLGDVMTFTRTDGGHVGLYVAESNSRYYVLGGNQSDTVNITSIVKSRFYQARNLYNIGQPSNCRQIFVDNYGKPSQNEQ